MWFPFWYSPSFRALWLNDFSSTDFSPFPPKPARIIDYQSEARERKSWAFFCEIYARITYQHARFIFSYQLQRINHTPILPPCTIVTDIINPLMLSFSLKNTSKYKRITQSIIMAENTLSTNHFLWRTINSAVRSVRTYRRINPIRNSISSNLRFENKLETWFT